MSLGLGNALPYRFLKRGLGQAIQALLDAYPNAAAAYSTRKMRTAYAGACLRVRRSSDNTEQDIGFSGLLLNESQLLAFTGAGSGFVVTWYDQSGGGNNASQATQAAQPRIVNAGVVDKTNGKPAVVFNGTSHGLVTASFSSYPATVFGAVMNDSPTQGIRTIIRQDGGGGGVDWALRVNNTDVGGVSATNCAQVYRQPPAVFDTRAAANSVPTGTMILLSTDAAGSKMYRNGSLIATGTPFATGVAPGVLGLGVTSGANIEYWSGTISEVFWYSTSQESNRAVIEANVLLNFMIAALLLDSYSNAAAAYSTRLLRSGYGGACMRVRRTSDNTEQDIGFSAGALDETALLAFTGANSGFVVTWYDQSGNGRNATQATAANQPRIVNAGVVDKVNGKASPFFNGTSHGLATASFTSYPASVFATVLNNSSAGVTREIVRQEGEWALRVNDSPVNAANYYRVPTTPQALGATQSVPTGSLLLLSTNAAGSAVYSNGVSVATGAAFSGTSATGTVGIGFTSSAQKEWWSGNISEVLWYATTQEANRAAIESNTINHFGIT